MVGSTKMVFGRHLPSLKLTFSPLQMDGWNTTFLLGRPIFRGYVSFREGIWSNWNRTENATSFLGASNFGSVLVWEGPHIVQGNLGW